MQILRRQNKRGGQAMILAVLALGGTILGATTVAGFLMLYQIRQASDFENSSKSIFAADAGIEWALYNYYRGADPLFGSPPGTLSNGATVQVMCYESDGTTVTPCNSTSTAVSAISRGSAVDTKRAFSLSFMGSSSTYP